VGGSPTVTTSNDKLRIMNASLVNTIGNDSQHTHIIIIRQGSVVTCTNPVIYACIDCRAKEMIDKVLKLYYID